MTRNNLARVETALLALPTGCFHGQAALRRYVVSKTLFNTGKSMKLVAEELGGTDYISLNFYRLASGSRLQPCEMSREKVERFILALRPQTAHSEA